MKFHLFIFGALVCTASVLPAAESVPPVAEQARRTTSTDVEEPGDSAKAQRRAAPQASDESKAQITAPTGWPADASAKTAPPDAAREDATGREPGAVESIGGADAPSAGNFQSEIIHSDPELHNEDHAAAEGGDRDEDAAGEEQGQHPPQIMTGGKEPRDGQGTEPEADGAATAQPSQDGAKEAAAVKIAPQPAPAPPSAAKAGEQSTGSAAPAAPEDVAKEAAKEAAPEEGPLFPTSPLIERQIGFWIKIFTQVGSKQGLIHDKNFTMPIYAEVDLEGLSRRRQNRFLKKRKRAIEAELKRLAKTLAAGESLDDDAEALLARLPTPITPEEIRDLADGVRFQRGLADRFREGLVRSGAVLEQIKRILGKARVPEDLAYLPHVESSFNLRGYSKFGAAGIWQFTRGTGRKFLTIKYEVDERLDPLRASQAAAKFLRQNYDRLGSWPLAITAYNHGPQGIERIARRKGTRELDTLIRICGCRRFKFASKNFYAEFLAAREVATRYQHYFGAVEMEPRLHFNEVPMPFYLEFAKALEILGIKEASLRKLNPALRAPVLIGSKYIPKGYQLRVPSRFDPDHFVRSVPSADRMKKQKLTEVARVRRGDTLYGLGRRHGVPWQVIARANNITAYHRIRPGQRLVIPRRGKPKPSWVGDAVAKVETPPARRVAARAGASAPSANGRAMKERMAGESSDIAFQRAEGAYLFQNFDISRYDPEASTGVIRSAYGETLGHYADWAGVSTRTIRRYNLRYPGVLRPGGHVVVPLIRASMEAFSQVRFEYHQSREEDFFSTYAVTEVIKVKVRRGDTIWHIAQSNNVPMWLFYQQNPSMLKGRVLAGMQVDLPVIEALSELEQPRSTDPRQAAN